MRFCVANVRTRRTSAFTLVEASIAVGLGTLILAVVASLSVYSARTFGALSNSVDLDMRSRNALDIISREVRQATAVVDRQTNAGVSYITLTNTDALSSFQISWVPESGTLFVQKSGQPRQVVLTGCDNWNVWLYNRAPNLNPTNLSFNAATNLASCKLVNMSWRCSRTILGSKINTESVQTAQIVLRNKVR